MIDGAATTARGAQLPLQKRRRRRRKDVRVRQKKVSEPTFEFEVLLVMKPIARGGRRLRLGL